MEQNPQLDQIQLKLAELEGKLDASLKSQEKVRKYLMVGFWLTIAMILVPLIAFPLVVGPFLAALTGSGSGLGPGF